MSNNSGKKYSVEWFNKQKTGSLSSARVILPLVMDMVLPKSVVDVGCGVGLWLAFLLDRGVDDILGIDGGWVQESELHIPKKFFRQENIAEPFTIGRKADLVLCLEVGEHLPPESAEDLVKALTDCAPVVLFSAAIPHQGGTGHLNEQWPQYWARFFKEQGYMPVDAVRRKVWTNPQVEYWYAQNTFLYVRESLISCYPKLETEVLYGYSSALPLVHPRRYLYALKRPPNPIYRAFRKMRFFFNKIVAWYHDKQ